MAASTSKKETPKFFDKNEDPIPITKEELMAFKLPERLYKVYITEQPDGTLHIPKKIHTLLTEAEEPTPFALMAMILNAPFLLQAHLPSDLNKIIKFPTNDGEFILYGTLLQIACFQKHARMAHFLLDKGADPYVFDLCCPGSTLLHDAANANEPELAQLLLAKTRLTPNVPNPNQEGLTPMHVAAKEGNVHVMAAFIEYNKQHNLTLSPKTKEGVTPFVLSCTIKDRMCSVLLATALDV